MENIKQAHVGQNVRIIIIKHSKEARKTKENFESSSLHTEVLKYENTTRMCLQQYYGRFHVVSMWNTHGVLVGLL